MAAPSVDSGVQTPVNDIFGSGPKLTELCIVCNAVFWLPMSFSTLEQIRNQSLTLSEIVPNFGHLNNWTHGAACRHLSNRLH